MKNFLIYLKESIALNTPFDLKDEKEQLLFDKNIFGVKDIPLFKSDLEKIQKNKNTNRKLKQKRASILKKYNLEIKDGEIVTRDKSDSDEQFLIPISNKELDFNKEAKEKLKALDIEISAHDSKYKKNLRFILKNFFTLKGRRLPKRYIYLPVSSSTLNFSTIDKINANHHLDILLKIKNGFFTELAENDEELFKYLTEVGYKLTKESYYRNECVNKNGKTVPIDQELKNIEMINISQKKKALEKNKNIMAIDKINQEIIKKEKFKEEFLETITEIKTNKTLFGENVIILTWVPRLIMSQSTNTIWTSCMQYCFSGMHGSNVNYVPSGIEGGVFIAWLVNLYDTKIQKPIARALIKPRTSSKIENKTFYWPSNIYTSGGQKNIISNFRNVLRRYFLYKQKNLMPEVIKNKLYLKAPNEIYRDEGDDGVKITIAKDIINDLDETAKNKSYFEIMKKLQNTVDMTKEDLKKILTHKEFMYNNNYEALVTILLKMIVEFKMISYFNYIKDCNQKLKDHLIISILSTDMSNIFDNNFKYFKYFLNILYSEEKQKMIDNELVCVHILNMYKFATYDKNYLEYIKILNDFLDFKIYKNAKKIIEKYKINIFEIFNIEYEYAYVKKIIDLIDIEFNEEILNNLVENRANYVSDFLMSMFINNTVSAKKYFDQNNFKEGILDKTYLRVINSLLGSKQLNHLKIIIKDFNIVFSNNIYNSTNENIQVIHSLLFNNQSVFMDTHEIFLNANFDFKKVFMMINDDNEVKNQQSIKLISESLFTLSKVKNKKMNDLYEQVMNHYINDMKSEKLVLKILKHFFTFNLDYQKMIDLLTKIRKFSDKYEISIKKSNMDENDVISEYVKDKNLSENQYQKILDLMLSKKILTLKIDDPMTFIHIVNSKNKDYFKETIDGEKIEMYYILNMYSNFLNKNNYNDFTFDMILKSLENLKLFKEFISFKDAEKVFSDFLLSNFKTSLFIIFNKLYDYGFMSETIYQKILAENKKILEMDINNASFAFLRAINLYNDETYFYMLKKLGDFKFILNNKTSFISSYFTDENMVDLIIKYENKKQKAFYKMLTPNSRDIFMVNFLTTYIFRSEETNYKNIKFDFNKMVKDFDLENLLKIETLNYLKNHGVYLIMYVDQSKYGKYLEKNKIINLETDKLERNVQITMTSIHIFKELLDESDLKDEKVINSLVTCFMTCNRKEHDAEYLYASLFSKFGKKINKIAERGLSKEMYKKIVNENE